MRGILLAVLVNLLLPIGLSWPWRLGASLLALFAFPKGREEARGYSIDRFAARQKLAGRLSKEKMIFFVLCLFLSLLTDNPWIHGFITASMLLFLSWLGLGVRGILHYMSIPLVFILLSVLSLLVVFHPGGEKVLFSLWGRLYVTEASHGSATVVLMRALAGLSCLYGLSLSSTMGELFTVLQSFLPEKIMEILFMMYRFIFILIEFLNQMMDGARARGGRSSFGRSLYSSGIIASSLLFRSMEQTSRTYDALLTRGYSGGLPLDYVARKERKDDRILRYTGIFYLFILLFFLLLWR